MKLWQTFKLIFAVISLTDILVYQEIGKHVRSFFGWTHDEDGDKIALEDKGPVKHFFGKALNCFRCTSVWVSFILVILKKVPGYEYLETILFVSWLATYINRKSI